MNQLSGYVYLHKPMPMHQFSAPRNPGLVPASSDLEVPSAPAVHSATTSGASDPSHPPAASSPIANTSSPPPHAKAPLAGIPPEGAPRDIVGRLLIFWLEALSGRRSIKNLQRAPFTPAALAELERTIKREQGNLPASRIQSLHIQPSTGRRTRFCASVAFGVRVRAVVGTLSWRRLDPRIRKPQRTHAWHVEVIQMI